MAFPLSPANNQTALVNGIVYQWNAGLGVWKRNGSVNSIEVGQLLLNSAQQTTSNGSGTLIVSGGAGITGNVYTGGIFITGAANGITFADGSVQTTGATGIDSYARTTANTASSNTVVIQGIDTAQNTRMTIIEGVDTTQNTNITIIQGVDVGQNTRMGIIEGVDTTQNTNITIIQGVDVGQNTRMGIIEGVNTTQNTNITAADTKAQAAFNAANTKFSSSGGTITGDTVVTGNLTVTGTQFYANTVNLTVVDNIITLNSNVTGAPTLSAGLEVNRGSSSNTKLLWSEANTSWEFTNNGSFYDKIAGLTYANAAFAAANTNATNITILQGVDATQNTNITNVDTKAQAAFDKANSANVLAQAAFNTANSAGAVSITDDTTNSGTYYPLLSVSATGTLSTSNTSSSKLSYVPSTGTLTTVDLNTTSDIKFKENIQTIDSALEMINRIDGVSFNWKETGKKSYGVVAQQLQEVLPELVSEEERGLSVSYLPIIAILIEAIKEQQKQINDLKK